MTNTNPNCRPVSILERIGVPLGLALILLATAVPFVLMGSSWADPAYKYVYAAGALLLLVARLFSPFRGSDMRLKRLHRIEAWSAVFFCAAAVFLFYPGASLRDWIAFTLAGAIIQVITSIAIPAREAKLKGKQ